MKEKVRTKIYIYIYRERERAFKVKSWMLLGDLKASNHMINIFVIEIIESLGHKKILDKMIELWFERLILIIHLWIIFVIEPGK
jgi:hypothetical protein